MNANRSAASPYTCFNRQPPNPTLRRLGDPMNHLTKVALGLAVPLALALASPIDVLRFGVPAETVLDKSFSTKVEMSLTEVRMVQNGQEIDPSQMGMEITIVSTADYNWLDTYGEARENGAPKTLSRQFVDLSNSASVSQSTIMGSQDIDVGSQSELTDQLVNFTWDADSEEYVASFPEDSKADPELLTDLTMPSDLTFLLPAGEVEVGAEWKADLDKLAELLGPGGDLKLKPNEDDLPEEARGQTTGTEFSMAEMLGEVDGVIVCTYLGTRTEDGFTFAVIQVEIEISASNDMTEMMREQMENSDSVEVGPDMEFNSVDAVLEIDGAGELHWDQRAGHFVAFEFSGEITQVIDVSMSLTMGTQALEIEQAMTMAGSVELNFQSTPE